MMSLWNPISNSFDRFFFCSWQVYVESSFATLPCLDLAAIAEFVLFLLCFSSSLEVMAPNDKRQGQESMDQKKMISIPALSTI